MRALLGAEAVRALLAAVRASAAAGGARGGADARRWLDAARDAHALVALPGTFVPVAAYR